MNSVRAAGWAGASVLAAVGLLTAQSVVVALALVGAVVGGLCASMYEHSVRATGRAPRSLTDTVVRTAFLGLTGVLAVAGLVALIGSAALLVVLVSLTGAAWRGLRAGHRPGGAVVPAAGAGTLSDAQLARAWQDSRAQLARTRGAAELARVSAARRELLDEMERRDEAGFRQWLGDPARFLGG